MANFSSTRLAVRLLIMTLLSIIMLACNGIGGSADDMAPILSFVESDATIVMHDESFLQYASTLEIHNDDDIDVDINYTDSAVEMSSTREESYNRRLYRYAYAANGNKIAMFRVESGGTLTAIGALSSNLSDSSSISAIVVSPNNKFVYATVNNGSNDDKILMLSIDVGDGKLHQLSTPILSTGKTGTSSIVVSKDGRFAYVTDTKEVCTYVINYDSGILNKSTCTSPTINGKSSSPYAQVILSASNKYAFVIGGAYAESILTFNVESSTGALNYISAYSNGSTRYNRSMVTPTLGHYLYTALKGNNATAQYSIEPSSGRVSALSPSNIGAGEEPHAVAISENGKYVYVTNFYSNTISQYGRHPESGTLFKLNPATVTASNSPDKITIDPSNSFVYVSTNNGQVLQYAINESTGKLTALSPSSITVTPTVGQLAIASVRRPNVFFESADGGNGIERGASFIGGVKFDSNFIVEIDDTVNPDGLSFELYEESQVIESQGEVHTSQVELVAIGVAATALAANQYLLNPQPDKLDPGKKFFIYAYGMYKTGQKLQQKLSFTTQIVDPTVVYPIDLSSVPIDNTEFIVAYPYSIDSTLVNSDTLYLTQAGSTEHIPAYPPHIITECPNDMIRGYCVKGSDNRLLNLMASIRPDITLDPDSEYDFYIKSPTGEFKTRVTTKQKKDVVDQALLIYVARNTDYQGFTGDLVSHVNGTVETGIEAADLLCNTDRRKPLISFGGSGYYKAMLLAETRYPCNGNRYMTDCSAPRDWVISSGWRYINAYGEDIGTANEFLLLPNTLINPIDLGISSVWTGSRPNWTRSYSQVRQRYDDCNSWTNALATDDAGNRLVGRHGEAQFLHIRHYLSDATTTCDIPHGIYCVEQPGL